MIRPTASRRRRSPSSRTSFFRPETQESRPRALDSAAHGIKVSRNDRPHPSPALPCPHPGPLSHRMGEGSDQERGQNSAPCVAIGPPFFHDVWSPEAAILGLKTLQSVVAAAPASALRDHLHEPTHTRPLPRGELGFVRSAIVPLLGGVRGGFMVPMLARKRKEALHEPQGRAGVSPAQVGNADETEPLALARSLGRRDACPTLGGLRFLVPMHAQKRKEAQHEPERGAPARPSPARQGHDDRAGLEPRAPIPRFLVPMRARKRKGAVRDSSTSKQCPHRAEPRSKKPRQLPGLWDPRN